LAHAAILADPESKNGAMRGYHDASYGDAFADVYDDWYHGISDVEATVATLVRLAEGAHTSYVGYVICRQRPGTASGVVFFTLEDETGFVNAVVWSTVFEQYEALAKTASLLGMTGRIQSQHGVVHLIAEKLFLPDLSLPRSASVPRSRDFH